MKILQEDVILIKNLYLSKQYGARRVWSELPDKGWKLGRIDSLLNGILKTGTTVQRVQTDTVVSTRHSRFGINTAVVPAPIENFFISTILYLLAL